MHETNGELMERNDKYKLSDNMFNDALVVISNCFYVLYLG